MSDYSMSNECDAGLLSIDEELNNVYSETLYKTLKLLDVKNTLLPGDDTWMLKVWNKSW